MFRGETAIPMPRAMYWESAPERYDMMDCNGSVSPKIDKAEVPRGGELLGEYSRAEFRSVMLALLYLTSERPDITTMARLLCLRLKMPDQKDERQLKMLLPYIQYTKYAATICKPNGVERCVAKVYTDIGSAQGPKSRESASGASILSEGCRTHARSGGQAVVAPSSCRAELYAACAVLKGPLLINTLIELFLRAGTKNLDLLVGSSAAWQLCHQQEVGKQKHLEIRALCLQEGCSTRRARRGHRRNVDPSTQHQRACEAQ